ncbi:MAG TPA: hypothetical protein HPP77_10235 [Candidatus Hydrogenedentes bacterium]|nr:hypothetical protein [Candidatus Hydrogenedentota bacterium]
MGALVLPLVALAAVSCQTTKEEAPEPLLEVRPVEFIPATHVAPIQRVEGKYPTLFAPSSYAVWVDGDVAAFKRASAAEAGETVDPYLETAAELITASFYIFECHVESVFATTSIAYDVVGFRNTDIYLETPDGDRTKPIQTVIGTTAEMEPREALKLYRRTNLVIFPKKDLWLDEPVIDAKTLSVKLVLEGFDSKFCFEWPGIAPPPEPERTWYPRDEKEALQLLRLGFSELFEKLRDMATHLK